MTLNNLFVLIINAVAHAIGFSVVLYNVCNLISKKRFNVVILICMLFVASLGISFISEAYILIVIFIVSFLYLIRVGVSKWQSLLNCVVTIAVCLLDLMLMNSLYQLFDFSAEDIPRLRSLISYNVAMSAVYIMLSIICSLVIHFIGKRFHNNTYNEPSNIWGGFIYVMIGGILFLLGITTVFSMFTIVVGMDSIREYLISCNIAMLIQWVFSAIVGVIVLFATLFLYTSYKFTKQKKREFEIEKDKEIAKIYKTEIQNMYNEISDFKHDYMKIYSSMSILLVNDKIEELKQYFSDEIIPLQDKLLSEKSMTHNLTLIDDSIIQGLVYTYALKARNTNINFYVALDKEISSNTKISSLDLSRMLGILLDNAFEEMNVQTDGAVQLSIARNNDSTVYTVKNTCNKQINVQELLSGKYSSKGEGRGRGIKILRSICDKYKSALFNINYDQRYFTAEIVILD